MQHITVVDDSVDDMARFRNMLQIDDWIAVVQELDDKLCHIIKHENRPQNVHDEVVAIRHALYELLNDRNLELYS